MADSSDPQVGGIEVSPEELRFLRGFVRRQLAPWSVVLLVLCAAMSWGLAGNDASETEVRTAAALAQVRSDNQALRAELEALAAGIGSSPRSAPAAHAAADELERRIEEAQADARAIEQRIAAQLDRRLGALEARLGSDGGAQALAGGSGPPPDASAWDVSAILDRLYALEMRDGGSESAGAKLGDLERRVIQLEAAAQGVPLPAAAPSGY